MQSYKRDGWLLDIAKPMLCDSVLRLSIIRD